MLTSFNCSASADTPTISASEAYQAAEILGIRPQVDRLLVLQQAGDNTASKNEILRLRVLVLRKILLGFLAVRRANDKTDVELAYTYDVMRREEEKQSQVFQVLNILNFAQLSTFYTIEPWAVMNNQFKESATLTCVSAGLGTALPLLSVLYGKYHKIGNLAPPKFLKSVLDGAPVDTSAQPDLIKKYLDTAEPGATKSRKELLFESWKNDFRADPVHKETLGGINDGKPKGLSVLNTRASLLWSVRSYVQDFDHELMALSNLVKTPNPPSSDSNMSATGLSRGALEAARLLRIEGPCAELISLNRGNTDSYRRLELETLVLERILSGTIDARLAVDKVDSEMNYNYNVVLAQLLFNRFKGLQKNFEANFIQNGTFGSIAGYCYLKNYSKAGDELFVVASSIGTALSSLALVQIHGGSRKNSKAPNSLADFFALQPDVYHFSPLVSEFLNSPSTESNDGKSRKEFLIDLLKKRRATTMNLDSAKTREKVAGTAAVKRDTINLVTNRVILLRAIKANIELIDQDLLELAQQTALDTKRTSSDNGQIISVNAFPGAQAASLLGTETVAQRLIEANRNGESQSGSPEILNAQLSLTRNIMTAMLDVRSTVDKLDHEIARETQIRDRMQRSRDLGIALTNNANFFQLNILGIIIDGPLGLSSHPTYNHEGSVLNVVSGYLVGGLALASFLQTPGGFRPTKAEPNLLGALLSLETPSNERFSPLIWNFLNATAPASESTMTRKEQLLAYWKGSKSLHLNLSNHAAAEKVSATGNAHHWWNERIKLINSRLRMLYGVRGTVDLLDYQLSDLLGAVD